MFDVIVSGTKHLLKVCESAKPSKILLISSGAVYGKQDSSVVNQPDDCMFGPDVHDAASSYAEGKRVSELLGAFHHRMTTQEVTFARCFAFVGPYLPLDTHFAAGNFMRDCLAGREIVIQGDGTPHRSYLYAADLVVWLLKILVDGKNLRSYNVGAEESVSIRALAERVSGVWKNISGQSIEVRVLGQPVAGAPLARYVPSTARARLELGLSEGFSLEEAFSKTLTWSVRRAIPN
jgi:dTDP-glucose 4,6-dehydratase